MLGSGTSRQSDETKKDAVPVRNVYIPPLHVLVSTMGLGAERALAARAYIRVLDFRGYVTGPRFKRYADEARGSMRYPGYAYDVLHSGTTQEPPSGPPYRTSVHRCVRGAALWARPCDCEAVSPLS